MMKPMRSFVLLYLIILQGSIGAIAQCDIFTLTSPSIIQTSCDGLADVCTNLAFEEAEFVRFFIDGQPINQTTPCDFDTLRFYTIDNIVAIGTFAPYYLNNWRVNDEVYSTEFRYMSQLLDSMNIWDPIGNWDYNFASRRITGGNAINTYGNLNIEVIITNTQLSTNYTTQFLPKHIAVAVPLGIHLLEAWHVEEQCRDSVIINAICTQPSRLSLTLEQGLSRTICLETNELIREVEEIRNISTSPQHYTWERSSTENCVQFNGRSLGTDMAQMLICDRFGICDTTTIFIEVREQLSRTSYQALLVEETASFCVDRELIAMPSPIDVFSGICSDDSEILEVNYDPLGLCVNYKGLNVGQVEECIQICDQFTNCDTLSLNISVVEPQFVYDTLLVNVENGNYCLETTEFDLNSLRIEQSCTSENSIFEFNENTRCFSYKSSDIRADSVCVWMLDEAGNASYTVLHVLVRTPVPSIVYDSVFINQSMEICINRDELPGQLRRVENICADSEEEIVEFFPTDENCIEVTGLQLGQEEACFVLCDNFGYCDTTFLRIQVVPYLLAPSAEDDAVSTNQNEAISIAVQSNDDILGGLESLRILVHPTYGQAYVEDGQIIYTPDLRNCIGEDLIQYEICNSTGCDIATVRIAVNCSGIEVFTAMSPNGDGINEVLFVANISAYPENSLSVYNRWGALVYEGEGYENDWAGIWKGRILPDGTYFYVLEIEEKGQTQVYRGYVELHR